MAANWNKYVYTEVLNLLNLKLKWKLIKDTYRKNDKCNRNKFTKIKMNSK